MPKHQKVTTYQKDGDETKIVSKSYFEKLAQVAEEIEKPGMSSFYTLKKDVELALNHILEDGAHKLTITIEPKGNNGDIKFTKRWVTVKQNFPRR